MLVALAIDGRDLRARAIEQRSRSEQVRVPGAVALEDVELVRGAVLVVAAEGPGARVLRRVGGGGVERAERDARVEVAEDELDRWQQEGREGDAEDVREGPFGGGVPAEGVGPGHADVGNADAAGFGEAEADAVPVVSESGRGG